MLTINDVKFSECFRRGVISLFDNCDIQARKEIATIIDSYNKDKLTFVEKIESTYLLITDALKTEKFIEIIGTWKNSASNVEDWLKDNPEEDYVVKQVMADFDVELSIKTDNKGSKLSIRVNDP